MPTVRKKINWQVRLVFTNVGQSRIAPFLGEASDRSANQSSKADRESYVWYKHSEQPGHGYQIGYYI